MRVNDGISAGIGIGKRAGIAAARRLFRIGGYTRTTLSDWRGWEGMRLDTSYLDRSVAALESAFALLQAQEQGSVAADVYRAACVKEFEIAHDLCGSLMKKRLAPFFGANRDADRLSHKDVFRHAAKHILISADEAERWMRYRDVRNQAAHLYGARYADDALAAIPALIEDAKAVSRVVGEDFE